MAGGGSKKSSAKERAKLDRALEKVAKVARMNVRKARKVVAKLDVTKWVADDLKQGRAAGVRGTPTIFIHGRLYKGMRTVKGFLRAIDSK